jgi:hypothetical protein
MLKLDDGWGIFAQNLEGAILRDVMLQGLDKGIGWINMVKFLWVWLGQNRPLRWLMCFAFFTLRVCQWFLRVEILALLGLESLVSPEA